MILDDKGEINVRHVLEMVIAARKSHGETFEPDVVERGIVVARDALRAALVDFVRKERKVNVPSPSDS